MSRKYLFWGIVTGYSQSMTSYQWHTTVSFFFLLLLLFFSILQSRAQYLCTCHKHASSIYALLAAYNLQKYKFIRFSQSWRDYLKKHWTNTKLVCTHLNTFFILNPHLVTKFEFREILKKKKKERKENVNLSLWTPAFSWLDSIQIQLELYIQIHLYLMDRDS